jgi:hypothetical protein
MNEQQRPKLQPTLGRALGQQRQQPQQRERYEEFKSKGEWKNGETTRLAGHLHKYDKDKGLFIEQRPAPRLQLGGSRAHTKTYEQAKTAWEKDRERERDGSRGR